MKRKYYFFIIACLLVATPALAEKDTPYELGITGSLVQKTGNTLQIRFTLDYSQLTVPSNDQLVVSPVIVGQSDTLWLPYLLFPGKTRSKVNQRMERLYGKEAGYPDPYATLYPDQNTNIAFLYQQEIPFENWMYGARLELQQNVYGCADCHRLLAAIPLNTIANPPQVAFIIPLIDTVREERITLHIDFPWDQSVIRYDFRNNAAEMEKINRSMQKILHDRAGKLRQVSLTGYASPEGSYAYNTRLAGRRVQAVKNHIVRKYPDTEGLFVVDTVPEDWQGVRRWADHSDLRHRSQVLAIIDRPIHPDKRDNLLRQLDGNTTYRILLRQAYPPLRRVEYQVNYSIEPYTINQCMEIYPQHPEQLTTYELYKLAQSYPEDSEQYYDIILVTAQLYPNDPIANNNATAAALLREDLATARYYLPKCGNGPQTLNNQGVLFLLEGKLPEACQCFRDSRNHGCQEAILNLHNLEQTHYTKP